MFPVIHIGPAAIQSIILALLVALWLGTYITERECKRRDIDFNETWNIVALGIAVTIFSARLIFVAQNWGAYVDDLRQIISPTPNALSLDYGLLVGFVIAYAYIRWRKIPLARFADASTPGVLVAIALIAFGQFLSGDAFGTPTRLPWAVSFWGELIHPVQLYDASAALIGWVIIWRIRAARDGLRALIAIACYSAARVFIDAFRSDATLIGNGYRASQIIALIILLIALWFIGQQGGINVNESQIGRERASG